MPESSNGRPPTATALNAAIQRNADTVRRGRKKRGEHGFLKSLGLSLPVTVDDVKQAFYTRAKEVHPDHNGDAEEFRRVQEAFDEALKYAESNGKRLPWLGAQLPLYAAQREVADLVSDWGGRVHIQQLTWLEDTVGEDFAQLADRLNQIDLSGCDIGDDELRQLFGNPDALKYLETLNLTDTNITDDSVLEAMKASQLRQIDLRGTRVSFSLRRQLARLPRFDEVGGASRLASWFGR